MPDTTKANQFCCWVLSYDETWQLCLRSTLYSYVGEDTVHTFVHAEAQSVNMLLQQLNLPFEADLQAVNMAAKSRPR